LSNLGENDSSLTVFRPLLTKKATFRNILFPPQGQNLKILHIFFDKLGFCEIPIKLKGNSPKLSIYFQSTNLKNIQKKTPLINIHNLILF
jgi:hypothetical protein